MKRVIGIALAVGLLGTLLPSCSQREEEKPPQRIMTMQEAADLQKQATARGEVKPPANQNAQPSGGSGPALNAAAPETVGQDINGKSVKLSDLKGKVVVLDFWATWCPPCRAMIPHSTQLVEKMKGKPFVFISVSADATKEALTGFLEKTKMPWSHWWDGASGSLSKTWAITGLPTVNVIDHKGILRQRQVGFNANDHTGNQKLDDQIDKLVKAAEDETKASAKP